MCLLRLVREGAGYELGGGDLRARDCVEASVPHIGSIGEGWDGDCIPELFDVVGGHAPGCLSYAP